jgi:hypothetical protein
MLYSINALLYYSIISTLLDTSVFKHFRVKELAKSLGFKGLFYFFADLGLFMTLTNLVLRNFILLDLKKIFYHKNTFLI